MKSAVNPPFRYPMLDVGSITYGLAHEALRNKTYRQGLAEKVGIREVILDNGADELGEGLFGSKYLDLILEIQPTEVIAPDVLGDTEETRRRTIDFLETTADDLPVGTSIMAVVQGQTKEDFLGLLEEWEEAPGIDVIGIPYDIKFRVENPRTQPRNKYESDEHAWNRISLLSDPDFQGLSKKPIHLLGMNALWEFSYYAPDQQISEALNIRSNDTTAPFAAARFRRAWKPGESGGKDWPALDFSAEFDEDMESKALNNLRHYFQAVGDYEAVRRLNVVRHYRNRW